MKFHKLVEKHRDTILATEHFVWKHPETGFKEWETQRYLADIFEKAGYELTYAGNIPGFYTDLDTGRPGPKILILGEMDALCAPNHFDCTNGNAHACGHNAQCAALVGAALALKEPGALDGLCGSIRFMAVPAEELIEIEFREGLRKQGIIHYLGGKVEFMYRGYMDGCDLAFMIHASPADTFDFAVRKGSNGCMAKEMIYTGVASHAGGSPQNGINSLYAANMGLNAINAIRETFVDDEHVRVHPIMTDGGQTVNIIPSAARLSTFVRGNSIESIKNTNRKVNRAIAGSAVSLGAKVTVVDRPGYSPLINEPHLKSIAIDVAKEYCDADRVSVTDGWSSGSTDMGDVSCVIPAIHPNVSGAAGKGHGDDYYIADPEKCCLGSASIYVGLAQKLLADDAKPAHYVIDNAELRYPSKEAFFEDIDHFMNDKSLVAYNGNTITVTV